MILCIGRASLRPDVELLETAAANRLAVWHRFQLWGMDAGGSDMRILTGVRSP